MKQSALFILLAFALLQSKLHATDFTPISQSFPKVINGAAAWGDFNNDGYLDLAMCGNASPNATPVLLLEIFKNNGNETFTKITGSFTGIFEGELKWADLNNDGYLDLIACGASAFDPAWSEYTASMSVYRNNGNETFTLATSTNLPALALCSVDIADVDKDGKPDIALSGSGTDGSDLTKIYRNTGNFAFTALATLDGLHHSRLKFGDYNQDGFPDLLLSGFVVSSDPKTYLYRNERNGTFTKINTGFAGVAYGDITWADLNSDGLQDVVFTGSKSGNSVKIYRNNYPSGFQEITETILPGLIHSTLDVADFDLDGDADLIFSGGNCGSSKTEIYLSNSDFSFTKDAFAMPAVTHGTVACGDFNNDSRIDFLLSGPPCDNSEKVTLLYTHDGEQTINPPSIPNGLQSVVNPQGVLLKWQKSIQQPGYSNALTYNVYIGNASGEQNILRTHARLSDGRLSFPAQGNNFSTDSLSLALPAGTYYWGVQGISPNYRYSVFSTEQSFIVTGLTSAENPGSTDEFIVAYNRLNDHITVLPQHGTEPFRLEVFSITGNRLYAAPGLTGTAAISAGAWNKGIYLIRIESNHTPYLTKVFVSKEY
jgi:hypothetical protein